MLSFDQKAKKLRYALLQGCTVVYMYQVEYENAVMLAHVEGIMAGAGRVDNWNFYISKSLNREARVKEQVRGYFISYVRCL